MISDQCYHLKIISFVLSAVHSGKKTIWEKFPDNPIIFFRERPIVYVQGDSKSSRMIKRSDTKRPDNWLVGWLVCVQIKG